MVAVQILLLGTALLALPASSAVARWNIANRNTLNGGGPLYTNFSTSSTSVQLTTTTISDLSSSLDSTSTGTPVSPQDVVDTIESDNALGNSDTRATIHTFAVDRSSPVHINTTSWLSDPPRITRTPPFNNTLAPPAFVTMTPQPVSPPPTSPAYPSQPVTSEPCTSLGPGEPMTVWLVVYTSTITFNGSQEDYTAPFPQLAVPTYCEAPLPTAPGFRPFPTQSLGPGESGQPITSEAAAFPTVDHPRPSAPLRPRPSEIDKGKEDGPGGVAGGGGDDGFRGPDDGLMGPDDGFRDPDQERTTITFITTDRNPSVAFPSSRPPPRFTQSWQHRGGPAGAKGNHNSVLGDDAQFARPPAMFTVTADKSQVVINTETFSNLKPGQSTTVTVDQGTFTIVPTAVIGHGRIIRKPSPDPTRPMALVTQAPVTQAPVKEVNVIGGQALTAIGKTIMVLHSTTYTYGVGIAEKTVVVDDDTILLGPSGVSVNGITLGGPAAAPTMTRFEIVGGATVTEIYPSTVVIEGDTITISPGMARTTTIVNGQTLTIGPEGITYSSITLPMAEAAIVTTFEASITRDMDLPEKTRVRTWTTDDEGSEDSEDGKENGEGDNGDEEDAGAFVRPEFAFLVTAAGIAIGVWQLV